MTEAIFADGPLGKVLEVGTGSGYQTAILSQLAEKVFTVERISGLATRARERLAGMGYRNIFFRHSDGSLGWAEKGPFDAIMVTAAAMVVPEALLDQLGNSHIQNLKLQIQIKNYLQFQNILVVVESVEEEQIFFH